MSFNEDPLGFTKETGSLLTGLGCSNLTQFKKRDIGLDDLKYLTDADLAILDVGDKFDYESFRKLSRNLIKKHDTTIKPDIAHVFKIIGSVERQLKVIHIYCKCLQKITPGITEKFIEPDKNLQYTDAFLTAADCTLEELKLFKKAVDDLQPSEESKCIDKKASNIKYILISGIGIGVIMTCVYIYRKFNN